ncbi:photosystem II [Trifolium repens]|nr:photosystem II [Trifolium repens]
MHAVKETMIGFNFNQSVVDSQGRVINTRADIINCANLGMEVMHELAVSQGRRYSLTLKSLLLLHPLLFLSHSFSFRFRSFHRIQTSSSSGRFRILFRRLFQIWIRPGMTPSRFEYECFGDVVAFDTTYRKNSTIFHNSLREASSRHILTPLCVREQQVLLVIHHL